MLFYHCWDQCTKYWSMETIVNNWYESSHAIDSTKIFSFHASNTLSGSLSQVSEWYLTLPSLTPREVLILLLREVCSLSLAVSPGSCASTRGVSARGLGVTPVSWTTDSESNVPGRRPWLQNTTLNILFVSYINIFSIFCILEVCAVFAVHYIKKINKSWVNFCNDKTICMSCQIHLSRHISPLW